VKCNLQIAFRNAPIAPTLREDEVVHESEGENNPGIITPCSSQVDQPTPCHSTPFEGEPT